MKIKRFIGKKVWGYMDFDISFNDGLNFLIGVNGTGKTTVLRLLRGLLMPNIEVLKDVTFAQNIVECISNGEILEINSVKDESFLILDKYYNKAKDSSLKIGLNEKESDYTTLLKLFGRGNGVSYLELDRFNNYSEPALKEIVEMIYKFVRHNITKKNDIEKEFRESVLSLAQSTGDKDRFLLEISEEYNKNVNALNAPLIRFVNSANLFFSEGDKVLTVDDAGEIIINIKGVDKPTTIYDLSSGEKQLIIMLGHIVFDSATVFVIDEPELSLHLSWQYKFAEALQTANPDAQFILATHAAGIIAKKSNEQYCIDLTPKKND